MSKTSSFHSSQSYETIDSDEDSYVSSFHSSQSYETIDSDDDSGSYSGTESDSGSYYTEDSETTMMKEIRKEMKEIRKGYSNSIIKNDPLIIKYINIDTKKKLKYGKVGRMHILDKKIKLTYKFLELDKSKI